MTKVPFFILRTLIAFALIILLLTQVLLLPFLARESARLNPEVAYLEVPMLVLAIGVVAAAQVILVAIWLLLNLVARNAIFSDRAYRYVDVIVGASVVIAVVLAGIGPALSASRALNGGMALMLLAGVLAGVGLATLMIVMKGLLRQAQSFRDELELVI